VPGLTVRTTFLLGFPGETDADVDELVQLIEEYRLGRLGAFTYSPEEGTHGYELPDRVAADVAWRRYEAVVAARDANLERDQAALVGTQVELLIDEEHATRAVGRTERDAPEVDLIASLEGVEVGVGERVRARVEALDDEFNLVCGPLAASATGASA
jgi:ribosomal protein S12 methylthiotransferase